MNFVFTTTYLDQLYSLESNLCIPFNLQIKAENFELLNKYSNTPKNLNIEIKEKENQYDSETYTKL